MCFNCPDMIDNCWQAGCYNPNGGTYTKIRLFYIDDEYCEHLKEKHGHSHAEWDDRYGDKNEEE